MSTERGDADMASYDSSSSSSSEDTVLITKKDRQKLQMKHKEREAAKSEDSSALRATPTGGKSPAAGSKVDHICGVCEKEGGALYVCTGSCVSAYHLECLQLSGGRDAPPRDEWKCPSCVNNTHVCFHCKQLGLASGDAATTPGGSAAVGSSETKSDLRAVVKCRALSCGKYYHQDCIAKLPLARIAGSRFICPLHTCAACEQSGAKKEPVRCTRCPVAYHTSCLPRSGVFHLPGKRIICPKHDVPPNTVAEKAENEGTTEVKHLPVMKRVASVEDDLSVAASSPRTEDNEDAQSDTSGTHGSSKKHSKSSKKEKKKKKKKRKKEKKKEKEKHRGDDEDGEGSNSKKSKGLKEVDATVESSIDNSFGDPENVDIEKITIPRVDNEEMGAVTAPKSSSSAIKMENLLSEQTPRSERLSIESADLEATEVLEHNQAKQIGVHESSTGAARHIVVSDELGLKTASIYPQETTSASVSDHTKAGTSEETAAGESGHEPEQKERRQDSSYQLSPVDDMMNDSVSTPREARGSDGEEVEETESQGEKPRHMMDAMKERSGSGRSKKSKKKKKGKSGESKRATSGADGEDDDNDDERAEDEAKWVQCDECKKWRTVPKEIDLDAMPETWYCKMNTWDKSYAACSVPEEVVETKKKSGKRSSGVVADFAATSSSSKKAKLSRQSSAADVLATGEVNDGIADKDKAGIKLAKKADKDSKKRKLKLKLKEKYGEVKWVQCENASCGKWRVVPPSIDFDLLPSVWYCNLNTWSSELASCSAPNPFEVEAYLSKSQSKKPASSRPAKRHKGQDQSGGDTATITVATLPRLEAVKSNSKTGKNTKGSTPTAHVSAIGTNSSGTTNYTQNQSGGDDGKGKKVGALEGVRSVVLEWAMCEKCQKWRKLPPHIKSSTLPDKWYCSMNHWDPSRASCSIPQEEDQEPVDASPLPSSQNWYPMPGQVGATTSTGGGSGRTKRGKLSYSELLYANTGQLRKTYTSESSTLTFDYEGVTYNRDDQYKRSCMYISPLTTNKLTGEPIDLQSQASKGREQSASNTIQFVPAVTQHVIDKMSKVILDKIDLRHDHSIMDIVESVFTDCTAVDRDNLSLSVITSALAQLVTQGEVEKVDRSKVKPIDRPLPDSSSSAAILLASLSSQPAYYRKVPRRPLKALKAWKHAEINIS